MWYKNKPIPDSVTSIRRICSSTLIIPTSVKTINAVSGKDGILMLSIKRVTPPNIDKAIYLAKDDVLIVPKDAARAYNNHSLWGKFKNISEDPSLQESASIRSSNDVDDDFNSGEDRNKSGVSKRKRDELQKKIAEIQDKRVLPLFLMLFPLLGILLLLGLGVWYFKKRNRKLDENKSMKNNEFTEHDKIRAESKLKESIESSRKEIQFFEL